MCGSSSTTSTRRVGVSLTCSTVSSLTCSRAFYEVDTQETAGGFPAFVTEPWQGREAAMARLKHANNPTSTTVSTNSTPYGLASHDRFRKGSSPVSLATWSGGFEIRRRLPHAAADGGVKQKLEARSQK
jgi:hypothetical protein